MKPPESAGTPGCFLRFGKAGAQTRMRLYCFAHAGGTAAIYAPWARLLSPDIEIYAVELPGHGTRMDEEPLKDVAEMARHLLPQICEQQADRRPFAFYGHSLGAVVAYETALALQDLASSDRYQYASSRQGPLLALQHLFIGAARAPHLPRMLPALSHLDQQAFLEGVRHRYGGISEAVLAEPELLEMILPPLRADFAAYENYQHQARVLLTCPVTAFAGTRDPVVQESAVTAWADHTSGPFRLHAIPGDHFFLAEHREQVLGIVSRALRTDALRSSSESRAVEAESGSFTGQRLDSGRNTG